MYHTTLRGIFTLLKTNSHYKTHKLEHALLSFPSGSFLTLRDHSRSAGVQLQVLGLTQSPSPGNLSFLSEFKRHLNSLKGDHLQSHLLLQLALLWLSPLPYLVLRNMKWRDQSVSMGGFSRTWIYPWNTSQESRHLLHINDIFNYPQSLILNCVFPPLSLYCHFHWVCCVQQYCKWSLQQPREVTCSYWNTHEVFVVKFNACWYLLPLLWG